MRWLQALLFLIALVPARATFADTPVLNLLATDDLKLLYFDPAQTYLVPYAGRSFHNSLEFQKTLFEWTPWEKTTVLLTDFSDYGNAGAMASPINMLSINVGPISQIFETFSVNERMFTLMNHEMVHVANLDAWNEKDARWRRLFGGKPRPNQKHPESILYNYLTVPRMSTPRWYTEGAAVFMETWMSGGIGRAQGAYDEMVFRSMVRDDAHFYSNLGLVSKGTSVDFQVGVNAYLYGGRFISYLGYEYTPQKVVEWLKRGEDSKRYYAHQFEHVFGQNLEDAWDDWIGFEKEFQSRNLEAVRAFPLTPTEALTRSGVGSVSRSFVDSERGSLIGAFRNPGVLAHVGEFSFASGEVRRLVDIKDPMLYSITSTAYDPDTATLFFTNDNHAFRDLISVDIESGDTRLLLKDARIGDLAFNHVDRSIWGLRHLNGYVTLVRIPHPYDSWNQVYTWPYGQVPYDIDISADGSMLSTSVGEVSGDQFLRIYKTAELLDEKQEAFAEFKLGTTVLEGFVFSPDNRYLYGSSYYTGVSNIFRYEIANGDIEAVSNAETGFFRPIPLKDGRLLVFEYSGSGFIPSIIDPVPLEDVSNITMLGTEIARKHPVVREWAVGSPANIPLDEMIVEEREYRLTREMGFKNGYPVIEGYRGEGAIGGHVEFSDVTQLHNLALTASYSWNQDIPSSERLHLDVEYQSLNWRARYWHNNADFYDLFGPVERSRKGDAFIIGYDRTLIYDRPRRLAFSANLAYYTGLDTLPNNQNVPTFFIEDILSLDGELAWTNTRKSLGAVDHEKGWRWNLNGKIDHSEFDTIPKLRGGIDFGFALPWKHSSIWFYNAAGWADGNRLDPLTNTYFGGFHNNWVDDREVKRYREYYSFPGFEIDQISAREYIKTIAEWNLPPMRFREVGSPSLYLKHARPAIFAGALLTDPGERFERTVYNVGFQVDFQFTLSHRLPMTFSVGFAAGFEDGSKRDDEWMISLKIL